MCSLDSRVKKTETRLIELKSEKFLILIGSAGDRAPDLRRGVHAFRTRIYQSHASSLRRSAAARRRTVTGCNREVTPDKTLVRSYNR